MPRCRVIGAGWSGSLEGRFVLFAPMAMLLLGAGANEGQPSGLRVEYSAAPLGIDEPAPRLAWHVPAARQSAYRIRVATSPEALTAERLVWDSGKVMSDANAQIPYSGPMLASRKRYWWQVATWDADGRQSGWSAPGWWETGLLVPADWQGQWIGGPKRTDHDWTTLNFDTDLTMQGPSLDLIFRARPIGKT